MDMFYKYVNQHVRHRNNAAAMIDGKGVVITSDVQKANMVNKYFASVGIVDDGNTPEILRCSNSAVFLNLLHLISSLYCLQSKY